MVHLLDLTTTVWRVGFIEHVGLGKGNYHGRVGVGGTTRASSTILSVDSCLTRLTRGIVSRQSSK